MDIVKWWKDRCKHQQEKEKLRKSKGRRYCKNCKRSVKINIWTSQSTLFLILFLLLWLLPGFIYVVWKMINNNKCPICKDDNFR